MHLKTAEGTSFKTDLFASPMYPQPHYAFEGAQPKVEGKPTDFAVRIKLPTLKGGPQNQTGKVIEGAREIVVNAVSGLKYQETLLKVKAREPIALKLINTDIMPHNLVIVAPGATEKIGMASFNMLTNPKAAEMNYAPKMPEVLFVVPVIGPNEKHTLYFRAPKRRATIHIFVLSQVTGRPCKESYRFAKQPA